MGIHFWRRGLSAEHVDTGTLLHMGATTLTYLTIVLIQLTNILQRRSQHGLFTRYQFHNRSLWGAMLLSLTCVLAIIYSPINKYFHAAPLGFTDWLFALLAVAIFVAIREFHIRTKQELSRALKTMFDGVIVKTILTDNDIAFTYWKHFEQLLGAPFYFTHPYHSWEKGLVENTNKWIRHFIPKRTDLSTVTKETITTVLTYLNERPRQVLGYKTANDVYLEYLTIQV